MKLLSIKSVVCDFENWFYGSPNLERIGSCKNEDAVLELGVLDVVVTKWEFFKCYAQA